MSAVSLYSNYSIVCGSEKVLFEVDPLPGNIGRGPARGFWEDFTEADADVGEVTGRFGGCLLQLLADDTPALQSQCNLWYI